MHKFISNTYRIDIDLTQVNITTNEENNWFSDTFFVKYSFPFDIILTPELNSILGDLISNNSIINTYIEGEYYFYDKVEKAVLIVEGVEGMVGTFNLKYGFDDFPNFDKKLQELGLPTYEVDDIYKYANEVIHKKYPQTPVNFPQILTDKYKSEDIIWKFFEKRLNNRIEGEFVRNTINDQNEHLNRNIIHPCVYLLYVLRKGFENAGYSITGEFFENNLAKKIMLFSDKDMFVSNIEEDIQLQITSDDEPIEKHRKSGLDVYAYQQTKKIPRKGKYNLIGDVTLRGHPFAPAQCIIKLNSTVVNAFFVPTKKTTFIDETVDVVSDNSIIEIIIYTIYSSDFMQFVHLQLLPVYYISNEGNKESSIVNSNTIDIGKACPDVTFGQLITATVNLFNLDISVNQKIITLNYKISSINTSKVHDFRSFEKNNPKIDFKADVKYLLKYEESEDSKKLDQILVDNKELKIIKPNETIQDVENTISIGAFPLLYDVNTVKSENGSADKINFLIYGGIYNNNNFAEPSIPLLLPNVYEYYHKEWIENRVQARSYSPIFICKIEDILTLNVKDRIFMHNNYHVLISISREQVSKDLFEVELVTETIKV